MTAAFQRAVAYVDGGAVAELRTLLDAHPELAAQRLGTSPDWLRTQVGDALDGFFRSPYLLWFVAEDPPRNGRLPANVVDIIQTIVAAARRHNAATLQEQLDSTLPLVCWSDVAARSGLQLEMIDALIDAGATPASNADNALVNGHFDAAVRLLERGGMLTLGAAVCLARWTEAERLFAQADAAARQFALVLAALNGRSEAVTWLIERGVAVDEPSAHLYAHATPLHHAVGSGSLDTVQVLVQAGANVFAVDTVWNGTPLGWAEHYLSSTPAAQHAEYSKIAALLRERSGSTVDEPKFRAN